MEVVVSLEVGTNDTRGRRDSAPLLVERRFLSFTMPSRCILYWRLVRLTPSLAAAPFGPPMVHMVS